MELSEDIKTLFKKYTSPKEPAMNSSRDLDSFLPNDIIDVDQIAMGNDEIWLLETEVVTENLHAWLHGKERISIPTERTSPPTNYMTYVREPKTASAKKAFDSRTFTRPKKKCNRPSIEKYNQELFESDKKAQTTLPDEIDKYISACAQNESEKKPLHFDLSQPVSNSVFFDRILATAVAENDSFQNMSPPSLVNSMCSSTFSNLMENSIIKNDPVLRQIRDTEYDDMISQDISLYQSITESCSSINSDAAETFLKRNMPAVNGAFHMQVSTDSFKTASVDLDDKEVFTLDDDDDDEGTLQDLHTENIDPNITINLSNNTTMTPNGTFRKSLKKLNTTFEKVPDDKLNCTFELSGQKLSLDRKNRDNINNSFRKSTELKHNGTFRKSHGLNTTFVNNDILENKVLNSTINIDVEADAKNLLNSKRLSLEIDEYLTEKMHSTFEKEDRTSTANSTDSLDRMSSLSSGSRGSRTLLMSEVDAIVEQQEKSLQVMSTPKPVKSLSRIFDNCHLSPVPSALNKNNLSDSEISSEEYASVRSALSANKPTLERNVRSLSNLKNPVELNKPRSINTLASNIRMRGSYSNLPSSRNQITGSCSNLKSLNTNLKSSYTNLRPFSSNLPQIPPKPSVIQTEPLIANTFEGQNKAPQVHKVAPQPASANGTFVKPQSRASNLPRPVATGIPRPQSRIPAPKTMRSSSARNIARAPSKTNINDGFY